MKKLMAILVLAGVLSVPSAVFAEASWYGSLRGGLQAGGGSDAQFFDGGSRWGIRGSAEAGEGLTAVYRFEHKISTTDGGQPGGRLAYAGLSGGFGTVTLGQIWSADYNNVGAITDKSFYFGNSHGDYRHGNALSYAISAGSVGFQMDLISDGGMDTGKAFDKTQIGMTIGLGEVGKIALSHTNVQDTMKMVPMSYQVGEGDDAMVAHMISVLVAQTDIASNVADDMLNATGLGAVTVVDGNYRVGDTSGCEAAEMTEVTTDDCQTVTAYVVRTDTSTSARDNNDATLNVVSSTVTETYHAEADEVAAHSAVDAAGHKATHVAVEFGLGGITPHLGYSQSKKNGEATSTKTTHYGLSGGLGDTGMSFLVAARSVKGADGTKTSPWLVNVSRGLGGGALVVFEHANDDNGKSGKSRVGLHVSF